MDNIERFKKLLGAEVGGTVDGGHWKCADCDAEGDIAPVDGIAKALGANHGAGLALHHHIQEARHWEDKDG